MHPPQKPLINAGFASLFDTADMADRVAQNTHERRTEAGTVSNHREASPADWI